MGKSSFFLDSNVLIDILSRKLDFFAFLESFPDCEIYINLIVAIEVLAKADMSEDEETAVRATR